MNSANPNQTDVLIVGAGPVGLMAACQLARHDVQVRIIDKRSRPAVYSGALFIQARTLEILDQMGLAEKFLKRGQIPKYISVLHGGKQVFRANIEKMGKGLSKFPYVLMVKQEETELLLIDHLLKNGVSDRLLQTYNRERFPMAEKLIRITDRLFFFIIKNTWIYKPFQNFQFFTLFNLLFVIH